MDLQAVFSPTSSYTLLSCPTCITGNNVQNSPEEGKIIFAYLNLIDKPTAIPKVSHKIRLLKVMVLSERQINITNWERYQTILV